MKMPTLIVFAIVLLFVLLFIYPKGGQRFRVFSSRNSCCLVISRVDHAFKLVLPEHIFVLGPRSYVTFLSREGETPLHFAQGVEQPVPPHTHTQIHTQPPNARAQRLDTDIARHQPPSPQQGRSVDDGFTHTPPEQGRGAWATILLTTSSHNGKGAAPGNEHPAWPTGLAQLGWQPAPWRAQPCKPHALAIRQTARTARPTR